METSNSSQKGRESKDTLGNTVGYIKELFVAGPDSATGKGLELGVGALLARTALKRLPVPLNFVAPIIVEKVILKHGVEEGREVLLKGLRWVKRVTDEKPDIATS